MEHRRAMRRPGRALGTIIVIVFALASFLFIAGCTDRGGQPTSSNSSSDGASSFAPGGAESSNARAASAVAYFSTPEHNVVPARVDAAATDAAATIEALFQGVPDEARQAGYSSAIPAGTKLLNLSVETSTAVVDVSNDFARGTDPESLEMRVAQVVFTLTRDPAVTKVAFRIGGKAVASLSEGGPDLSRPQAREDWEELSPRILVESPVLGDTVSGDFRVRGTAKVSDRTFRLEMQEPDGSIRTTQKVLASSKTDTRAAFEATGTATYAAKGPAEIVVIEIPPMSPERLVAMRVPVLVE